MLIVSWSLVLLNTSAAAVARAGRTAIHPLKHFKRNEDGATAIEFAMVSIPFLAVLFAIFETALVFFNASALDAVTANASRQLMTGQIQLNGQTAAQQKTTFQNLICPTSGTRPSTALPSQFDCSQVTIDVRASSDFSNADTTNALYANPTSAQFTPGSAGQVNIVRVIYPMPVFLAVLGGTNTNAIQANRTGQVLLSGSWVHILMGIAVFKTEPYS